MLHWHCRRIFHIHRNVDVVEENDAVDDWLDDWLSTVQEKIKLDLGDRVDTYDDANDQ